VKSESDSESIKSISSKFSLKRLIMGATAAEQEDAIADDAGEKIAQVMYEVRSSDQNLFDRLMVVHAPNTPEVTYLQMCVRYSELGQSWVAKRRNDAFDDMDPAAHWRLDQITGCLTSHAQKIAALTELLDREDATERQSNVHDDRFLKLWLFLEQFKAMKFLVRNRRLITPSRPRRSSKATDCEDYEALPSSRSASLHVS